MSINTQEKTQEPKEKDGGGLLHRLFDRVTHGPSTSDGDSTSSGKAALDLRDIQGIILRGYKMPMVRHFLLTIGVPAEARRVVGRLVSGDETDAPQITTAEEWQVGFEPGPGDNVKDRP